MDQTETTQFCVDSFECLRLNYPALENTFHKDLCMWNAKKPTPIPPQANQESVWDYPRPPALEQTSKRIQIRFAGIDLVNTTRAWRVLETSHPPVYYLPPTEIKMEYLSVIPGVSWCEWKGKATYYTLQVGDQIAHKVAWTYENPTPAFKAIQNYLAFYAQPMDQCLVDGEEVQSQVGGFYGGWVTQEIVGPFKGGPHSMGW